MAVKRTRGIDVSYYQGNINWQTVKAQGVDWVILRAGFGNSNVDTQFVNNITGAIAAGFDKIGVYWFSYAHDIASAQTEVAKCLATIEPYKSSITLPVWFDWEGASYNYVKNTYGISLTSAQIQGIAEAWCNGIISGGYSTGIYSNKSNGDGWFKRTDGQYLWEYLGVEFWYARYGANNETSLFVDPAFEETALSEHPEMDYFQFSDVGVMSGINSQRIDLNIRYEDVTDPPSPPDPPTPTPDPVERPYSDSIEYVEIRDTDIKAIGIIDTAQSLIWHSVYYGVGDFEIYIQATGAVLDLLQVGNYVTRPNDIEVGIIESVEITDSLESGKMIIAKGRFVKSILDRRHIYKLSGHTNSATILSGNVETAIRKVVSDNAINCTFDTRRNIPVLALGAVAGITKTIVDENGNAAQKQVSFDNLLEYTEGVLKEYGIGSIAPFDESTGKFLYTLYEGADRTSGNTEGNEPVVFGKEFDNLTESKYSFDKTNEKNTALIGGAGEQLERFYSLIDGGAGLDRRETFVDANSINRTYKDDSDVEQTYSDNDYDKMLKAQGKQSLKESKSEESFNGTLDITNGNYIYNRDFSLGDKVTVQDNDINKYIDVRIVEVTEVQDESGYSVEAVYESE